MNNQLFCKAGDLPAGTDIYINEGDSYAAFTVISQSYRSDNELALLIRKEPLPCTVEFMSNLYSAFDRDKLIHKRNLLNNANVLLNEASGVPTAAVSLSNEKESTAISLAAPTIRSAKTPPNWKNEKKKIPSPPPGNYRVNAERGLFYYSLSRIQSSSSS